jgi:hypothetical protein
LIPSFEKIKSFGIGPKQKKTGAWQEAMPWLVVHEKHIKLHVQIFIQYILASVNVIS